MKVATFRWPPARIINQMAVANTVCTHCVWVAAAVNSGCQICTMYKSLVGAATVRM